MSIKNTNFIKIIKNSKNKKKIKEQEMNDSVSRDFIINQLKNHIINLQKNDQILEKLLKKLITYQKE